MHSEVFQYDALHFLSQEERRAVLTGEPIKDLSLKLVPGQQFHFTCNQKNLAVHPFHEELPDDTNTFCYQFEADSDSDSNSSDASTDESNHKLHSAPKTNNPPTKKARTRKDNTVESSSINAEALTLVS